MDDLTGRLRARASEAGQDGFIRPLGGRKLLEDLDPAIPDQDEVREGAARINTDSQFGHMLNHADQ